MARSVIGLWLGLWTIAGVSIFASGVFIVALQLYGYFYLGFWAHLTPAGVLEGFAVPYPTLGWELAQKAIDCGLHLPLEGVFIWCGFHIATMTWIARKNIEKKVSEVRELLPTADPRFTLFGISNLEVRLASIYHNVNDGMYTGLSLSTDENNQ